MGKQHARKTNSRVIKPGLIKNLFSCFQAKRNFHLQKTPYRFCQVM